MERSIADAHLLKWFEDIPLPLLDLVYLQCIIIPTNDSLQERVIVNLIIITNQAI